MDQKTNDAPAEAQEPVAEGQSQPSQVGDLGKGSHEQSQGGKTAPSPPGYGDQ